MGRLNESASAVQGAGKRGVFRIKMSARTLADAFVEGLADISKATATELAGAFGRCERAVSRVPEGQLGAETFLSHAREALEALQEEEAKRALVKRGKIAAARRAAGGSKGHVAAGRAEDRKGSATSADAAGAAADAAAGVAALATQHGEDEHMQQQHQGGDKEVEEDLSLASLEAALALAVVRRDKRAAAMAAASSTIAKGYRMAQRRAELGAETLAPVVADAVAAVKDASATDLGGLLVRVRSALLLVRAGSTAARRRMLQSVGATLLPDGAKFAEALAEYESASGNWRKQRADARRKAAAAARAKADADAAATGGDPASQGSSSSSSSLAGGARAAAAAVGGGAGAGASAGVGSSQGHREGEREELHDDDDDEVHEEEDVLLGTTGSGGSVAVDESGQPKAAPETTDPALVTRKGRRRGAKGSAARVEAWFGAQVDVDVALGFSGRGAASSVPHGSRTGDGGDAEGKETVDAEPMEEAPAAAASSVDRAGGVASEAAAAGRAHAVEVRAREVAAAGGVFPSLFAVACLARAAARVRAAQLSASQSSVRALFSRFRGRMSAQADVLGEQAALATESIATVQDAALADTLEVVRTCVALLGSFRLSQAGFVTRANAVLGVEADRPDGQDPFGPAGEARFRLQYPMEIITLAERRAGARMGYLEERQRVLAGCWRGYTSKVELRAAQCGQAAAARVLDRVCSAGDRSAETEVDGVQRLLLLTPRTPAAMRGLSASAAAHLAAPLKPSLRVASMTPPGPIPAEVTERLVADSGALPAAFVREWVLRCETALVAAEAQGAAAREHIASLRRAHRLRFGGTEEQKDQGQEEEAEAAVGGSATALSRVESISVSADAVAAAARAALAGLGSDVLAAAHAADEEKASAVAAAADAAAAAGGSEETAGASEEALAEAAAASKRAREASWQASAAWVAVGLSPADVLSAARAALEARMAHLGATVVVVQRWVRRWRQQRSTASEAMAELVAATISEFQRALDRELEILSARAKRAVARVEKHKGERWFLDALNGRLKGMNGDGVAEAVAASAAGPE